VELPRGLRILLLPATHGTQHLSIRSSSANQASSISSSRRTLLGEDEQNGLYTNVTMLGKTLPTANTENIYMNVGEAAKVGIVELHLYIIMYY
jgi:hypothetical protein